MRRWFIFTLCLIILFSAGCDVDPDRILQDETSDIITAEDIAPHVSNAESADIIYAYICGAVYQPGVYELEPESRVFQLVEKAGGLTEEADTKRVNLADIVTDGQMLWIPGADDTDEQAEADGRVNINTAAQQELTTLPGIGETKAASIISYREKHGAFQSPEEIMQVDGIAAGTYEKLKDQISIK